MVLFSLVVLYSLTGLAHVFSYNLYPTYFQKKDSRLQDSLSPSKPQILITVTESDGVLSQALIVFEGWKGADEG